MCSHICCRFSNSFDRSHLCGICPFPSAGEKSTLNTNWIFLTMFAHYCRSIRVSPICIPCWPQWGHWSHMGQIEWPQQRDAQSLGCLGIWMGDVYLAGMVPWTGKSHSSVLLTIRTQQNCTKPTMSKQSNFCRPDYLSIFWMNQHTSVILAAATNKLLKFCMLKACF